MMTPLLTLFQFLCIPTVSQRHLEELARLGRDYHETLAIDEQEREIQVQVQKENADTVVQSLQRR